MKFKIALIFAVLLISSVASWRLLMNPSEPSEPTTAIPSGRATSTPTPTPAGPQPVFPGVADLLPGFSRNDAVEHPVVSVEVPCTGRKVSVGPVSRVMYQPAPGVDVVIQAGDAKLAITVGSYRQDDRDSIVQAWSAAPARCPLEKDLGSEYDGKRQEYTRIRAFDALVSPSVAYQERATPRGFGPLEETRYTAIHTLSNGWYLQAESAGGRQMLDVVVPVVAAKLDAALGTHFLAVPADEPPVVPPDPAKPVDLVSNISFGTLIRDPHCPLTAGVALEPNGQTVFHDVTGDGYVDALASYSCASTTSSNPANVYVFDGRHTLTSPPRQLAVLPPGGDYYLRDIALTVSGSTVRLRAANLRRSVPLCCPDQELTQEFTWTGSAFAAGRPILSALR